jgi:hypothetical protein
MSRKLTKKRYNEHDSLLEGGEAAAEEKPKSEKPASEKPASEKP